MKTVKDINLTSRPSVTSAKRSQYNPINNRDKETMKGGGRLEIG